MRDCHYRKGCYTLQEKALKGVVVKHLCTFRSITFYYYLNNDWSKTLRSDRFEFMSDFSENEMVTILSDYCARDGKIFAGLDMLSIKDRKKVFEMPLYNFIEWGYQVC